MKRKIHLNRNRKIRFGRSDRRVHANVFYLEQQDWASSQQVFPLKGVVLIITKGYAHCAKIHG